MGWAGLSSKTNKSRKVVTDTVSYTHLPPPNPVAPQSKEDPGDGKGGKVLRLADGPGKVMFVVAQKSTWQGLKIFSETHNDPTYR